MKRITRKVPPLFLIALGIALLCSCALFDQQTKKETKDPPAKAPAAGEMKSQPKAVPPEVKEPPKKAPAVRPKLHEHKPVPKESAPKVSPETVLNQQKQYYNDGMRYYTQAKYHEAKASWQEVIKLGPKTKLAAKARNYILKADQKLKYLETVK